MENLIELINKENINNAVIAIKVFSKIEVYLKENNIKLTEDIIEELLQIPAFNTMCEILINNYTNSIIDNGIEKTFLSDLIRKSLTFYKQKNKIVFKRRKIKNNKCGFDTFNYNMRSIPTLTDEETLILLKEAQSGNIDARNRLIVSNLRLISFSIENFCKNKNLKIDEFQYEDIFQESIFGLMKAIKLFDLNKENKFSTYAYIWIIHYIIKHYKDNKDIVYYSNRMKSLYFVFIKYIDDFWIKNQREASTSEIMRDLKVNEITAICLQKMIIPRESIDLLDEEKLDEKFSESNFDEEVINKILKDDILKIINELNNPKEEYVLREYFGFNGEAKSLRRIGEETGVSGSYIGYLKNKALDELRNMEGICELAVYLGDKKLDIKK